jgi:hypothetical protein
MDRDVNIESYDIIAKVPKQPVGWFESTLPKSAMNRLQRYIETAKNNHINVNKNLAGNISNSLDLEDTDNWFFRHILNEHIKKFKVTWPDERIDETLTDNRSYCLQKFWVNFQKQHEVNPVHNHQGIYSFVIFMKIPYDWREQHELPFVKHSNTKVAGNFEFVYTNILGKIDGNTYKLDSSSEGLMIFFPAEINHIVYPFYNSEEERISISGNIRFDTSVIA